MLFLNIIVPLIKYPDTRIGNTRSHLFFRQKNKTIRHHRGKGQLVHIILLFIPHVNFISQHRLQTGVIFKSLYLSELRFILFKHLCDRPLSITRDRGIRREWRKQRIVSQKEVGHIHHDSRAIRIICQYLITEYRSRTGTLFQTLRHVFQFCFVKRIYPTQMKG